MIRLLSEKTLHFNYSLLSSSRISYHYVRPVREIRNFSAQVGSSHNSALSKDVIVFKFDNPRFFKMMNFFAISQLLFWGYLAHWTFYGLKDVKQIKPVNKEVANKEISWWKKINLGESKYKNSIAALCLFFGYTIIFVGWTFTLKSVRYLIALKNGKDISIVTYTPFGQNRVINVPLRCISAQESRQSAKVYLPLKVKNMNFYYILDMKGEFKNPQLFDSVIGLKRKF